jgi:hypothetical protein
VVHVLQSLTLNMSSKRKWDQAAPGEEDTTIKIPRNDETKSASDAAAAAAAIAAKIAAQFAGGALGSPSLGGGSGQKDMHDAEFTFDIDINDLRNRYLLTKGSTQDQVIFYLTGRPPSLNLTSSGTDS